MIEFPILPEPVSDPERGIAMRRFIGRKLLPVALGFLSACASARTEPIVGNGPMAQGSYSFEGIVRGENRVEGRVREITELVVGTLDIRADGSLKMNSSHGACEGGQMVRGTARIGCRGVRVALGPREGTIDLLMAEEQEVRTAECTQWAPNTPRPTCLGYRTEVQAVTRWRSGAALVKRET